MITKDTNIKQLEYKARSLALFTLIIKEKLNMTVDTIWISQNKCSTKFSWIWQSRQFARHLMGISSHHHGTLPERIPVLQSSQPSSAIYPGLCRCHSLGRHGNIVSAAKRRLRWRRRLSSNHACHARQHTDGPAGVGKRRDNGWRFVGWIEELGG